MNKDRLTILYNESGKRFRNSRVGKLVKSVITSDTTKRLRDLAIDKIGLKEHEKRFIQHLSGGTVGNQPITELPEKVMSGVAMAHVRGDYRDRREFISSPKYFEMVQAAEKEAKISGDESSYNAIVHGDAAMIPNPKYNPDSKQLSTYGSNDQTRMSLGHVTMNPNKDGSFQMTDIYDVDSNASMGETERYTPLLSQKGDLIEGTKTIKLFNKEYNIPLASRAHDISTWLGIDQDMHYNVNIPKKNIDTWNNAYGKK